MENQKKTKTPCLRARRERGASLVEYSLLVALISIVAILAVRNVGFAVNNTFVDTSTTMGGGVGPIGG